VEDPQGFAHDRFDGELFAQFARQRVGRVLAELHVAARQVVLPRRDRLG
jgi:hypothetical protein